MKGAPPGRIASVLLLPNGLVAVFDAKGQQMAHFQGSARDFPRMERLAAACDSDTRIERVPGRHISLADFRVWLAREVRP